MITVVCSSRGDLSTFKEHVIKTSGLHNKLQFLGYKNDGEFSLTEIYNRGLREANNDIVVFMHDDITIEKNKWAEKITKLFEKNEQYGIIGVAGTKYLANTGKWWEDPKKMYGKVAHTHEGKTWLSSYSDDLGNELEEVVLVDGVFFAINKKRIKNSFNEDVKGFHFYDVNFCVENYLSGVKIGVTTLVRVHHLSLGMT
jgi:glycosyltransferase involved in cell wall biosynthesis